MFDHYGEFYRTPGAWPADVSMPIAAVFLPRAALMLGKAMFGSRWTGEEPYTIYPPPLPPTAEEASSLEMAIAASLLPSGTVEPETRNPPSLAAMRPAGEPVGHKFTPQQWTDAIAVQQRLAKERHPVVDRWRHVKEKLLEAMRSGTVPTFLRAKRGGELDNAAPGFWDTESWQVRFELGESDRWDPHSGAKTGRYYVFVAEAALAALCSRQPKITSRKGRAEFEAYMREEILKNPRLKPFKTAYYVNIGRQDFALSRDDAQAIVRDVPRELQNTAWQKTGRRSSTLN